MKVLKQKLHGLPGIGINGKTGAIGKKAKSIYTGFINEFFNGEQINVGTYIYAAKRMMNHNSLLDTSTLDAAWVVTQEEIKSIYGDTYIDSSLYNAVQNATTNPSSYINYSTFYYTNNRLLNVSINNGIISGNETNPNSSLGKAVGVELDLTGDFISMSFMLYTADGSTDKTFKQYKFEEDQKVGKPLNSGIGIYSKFDISEIYNIVNEVTYYDFNDSAKLLLNNIYDIINPVYLPYDTNDAVYINSAAAGEAIENGTLLTNSTYSDYWSYYPENTSTYFVNDQILYNSSNYYILDINTEYAELNEDGLSVRKNEDGSTLFLGKNEDIITDTWPSFYKTSFYSEDYYTSNDLRDFNNKSFYGVASPYLFLNKGTNNVTINDASLQNINFPLEYINNYRNAKNYMLALITTNANYVYYSLDQDDLVLFVPTTLKDEFVVGDILYFYINKYDYNDVNNSNYQSLTYMVVLTEELLHCTPTLLIESALLLTPFEIKLFSQNKNRICNYNNIAVLYNTAENNSTRLSNKSFVNIIDNYTDAPVILGGKQNNIINNLCVSTNNSNYNLIGKIDGSNNFVIDSSIIKLNNLCVNTNISKITNIELYNYVYNQNIILYDNFVKPLLDLNYYYDTNTLSSIFTYTIKAEDYFYNINDLDDYFYGCDIYNSKMEKINTFTSNQKTFDIDIIPTINNNVYYIQMFASQGSSIKYFSKITKLTLTYELFKYYNNVKNMKYPSNKQTGNLIKETSGGYSRNRYQITKYTIEVLGEKQSITKEKKTNNIFFDLSDISAEKIENASLFIYTEDPSIIINNILFNHLDLLTVNNWSTIEKDHSTNDFKYNINLSTNLPIYDNSIYDNINNYVFSGNNIIGDVESELFKNISDSNYIIPETKQRSILVTAEYYYVDRPNEKYYESFNIIQPGFKDTRDIPVFELNTHTNIEELTAYNSIENGVLTNQFVTYIDINIKDFKKQWGLFIKSNNTSIYLNATIGNIEYDLDWQNNYIVETLSERRSFKTILENNSNENDITQLNNYIKITSAIFETSDNLLTKNTALINDKDGSLNCGGSFSVSDNYVLYDKTNSSLNVNNQNDYILFDENFIKATKEPQIIFSGLQDNVLLKLTNIPLCDDLDTIKLKLTLEMGNPVLSNMYFRFVVSEVNIKVSSDINVNGQIQHIEKVFKSSTKDSYNNINNTYLVKTTTEVDGLKTIMNVLYKYISNPIDITFNPLSYIICPKDAEISYTNIYGGLDKYGIKDQIKKLLKFFNSSIYENNPFNYTGADIRTKKYYPFNNLYIKKSYIQDNVKAINVYPISLWDTLKVINSNTLSLNIDSVLLQHNILDFIEGNKYLSIIYHSLIMLPKLRNDIYNFYYNDNLYLRSKYNQKIDNMPVFVYDTQSIELRDDNLITSMDTYNNYYTNSKKSESGKTYQGILSLYGNGYTLILDDINLDTPYSLEEVKTLNDVSINLYSNINEVDIEPMKKDQPNNGEYFRGFLYDINWEFPYYNNENILPYRIVSSFDNFLKNCGLNIPTNYQDYYNMLTSNSTLSGQLYQNKMIPYNLLFNILPRIAYNYETNNVNILMLRRPTISKDTDIIDSSTFRETYEFNNQLFDLTSDIEKLTSPYKIK